MTYGRITKARSRISISNLFKSHPNIKDMVPSQIVLEQWYDLVDYWKIMKVEAIAVHNAGRHSFHYINHTTRRTSFNQIRRKMTAEGLAIDKMSFWKYTRNQTDLDVRPTMVCCSKITTLLKILEIVFSTRWSVKTGMDIVVLTARMCFGARCIEMHLKSSQLGSQSSTVAKITKQVSTELRQELRDEIREELREEMQAKLSTHIRQMKVEMLAIVSQERSTNHNKQVPDALSGHHEPTDYEADENPRIPPPDDEVQEQFELLKKWNDTGLFTEQARRRRKQAST